MFQKIWAKQESGLTTVWLKQDPSVLIYAYMLIYAKIKKSSDHLKKSYVDT